MDQNLVTPEFKAKMIGLVNKFIEDDEQRIEDLKKQQKGFQDQYQDRNSSEGILRTQLYQQYPHLERNSMSRIGKSFTARIQKVQNLIDKLEEVKVKADNFSLEHWERIISYYEEVENLEIRALLGAPPPPALLPPANADGLDKIMKKDKEYLLNVARTHGINEEDITNALKSGDGRPETALINLILGFIPLGEVLVVGGGYIRRKSNKRRKSTRRKSIKRRKSLKRRKSTRNKLSRRRR